MKKIAITGGIASGKSTVCRMFQELGAYVVDADRIVHELLTPATEVGQQVLQAFGQSILKQGKIDRKALAKAAFQNSQSLRELENILHPAVLCRIEELYEKERKTHTLFIVELPLLYEIDQEHFYDLVIAVVADNDLCRKRSHLAPEDFEARMARQLSPNVKAQRADYVISNNQTLDDLRTQVVQLNQKIQTESHGSRTSS